MICVLVSLHGAAGSLMQDAGLGKTCVWYPSLPPGGRSVQDICRVLAFSQTDDHVSLLSHLFLVTFTLFQLLCIKCGCSPASSLTFLQLSKEKFTLDFAVK